MTKATAITPTENQTAIRALSDELRQGIDLVVSGSIALGILLRREQEDRKQGHGGARCHDVTLKPWKEYVVELTGFSYRQCNRFCQLAAVVEDDLRTSRKKIAQDAKKLLATSPADWTAAQHHDFARYIGERFQASSFRGLMAETGLIACTDPGPDPESSTDTGGKPEKYEAEQLDFFDLLSAHDCIAVPILGLSQTLAAPDQFIRHCHNLPEDDLPADESIGRPKIFGRRTLLHILSQAIEQLERARTVTPD